MIQNNPQKTNSVDFLIVLELLAKTPIFPISWLTIGLKIISRNRKQNRNFTRGPSKDLSQQTVVISLYLAVLQKRFLRAHLDLDLAGVPAPYPLRCEQTENITFPILRMRLVTMSTVTKSRLTCTVAYHQMIISTYGQASPALIWSALIR